MIGADTSVVVRYLVGTPTDQARRAMELIDGAETIAISPVALAESAHVLRTQYGVTQADTIDSLIGLVQRENVRILGSRTQLIVEMLVRARGLPGRPIADALIVAASLDGGAVPLATFDRDQGRYGVALREP